MLPGGAFRVLLLLVSGASAVVGELDFPPVDLNVKDSGVTVSFRHPRLFYGPEKLKQLNEDAFKFTVSSDVGDFDGSCTAQQDDCKHNIMFPEGVEKCVTLKGSFVGDVVFRETGRICLSVPPPTNVTLSCSNLNVAVSWEFSKQQPQTSFRVHVGGSAGHYVTETTAHQYDLSHFIWASEERYLEFHYVTITAIEGGNQSESVTSKTFSFNILKPAHIKCLLDFPAVDLIESGSGATLSFVNPLQSYRELKQAKKPDTATFKFTVSSDSGDFDGFCETQQDNCKRDIPFPEDVEKCVSIKGWLFAGNFVGEVGFRKTGRICATASTEGHELVLVIMLIVVVIVIIVIIIGICKAKAWTMRLPHPPKPLTSPPHREGNMKYAPVSPIDISDVRLTDNKPCKISVSSEEEEEEEEVQGSSAGCDLKPPAGSYMEGGLSEEYRGGDDSADDSVKTETVSMDLEEEEVVELSPYDSRHSHVQTVQVDMGDGDMATGYTKRT